MFSFLSHIYGDVFFFSVELQHTHTHAQLRNLFTAAFTGEKPSTTSKEFCIFIDTLGRTLITAGRLICSITGCHLAICLENIQAGLVCLCFPVKSILQFVPSTGSPRHEKPLKLKFGNAKYLAAYLSLPPHVPRNSDTNNHNKSGSGFEFWSFHLYQNHREDGRGGNQCVIAQRSTACSDSVVL